MRRWVVEAEGKKSKDKPVVDFVTQGNLNAASIARNIEIWVGQAPEKVEVRGYGAYHIFMGSEKHTRKLLQFHGRQIQGWSKPLQLRLVDIHLDVEEIFHEIEHQMETQEKTAGFERHKGNQQGTQVRKASVQKEKKEKSETTPVSPNNGEQKANCGENTGNVCLPREGVDSNSPPMHHPSCAHHGMPGFGFPSAAAVAETSQLPFQNQPAFQNPQWGYYQNPPYDGKGKGNGKGNFNGGGNFAYKGGYQQNWSNNAGKGMKGGKKGWGYGKGGQNYNNGGRGKGGKGSNFDQGNPQAPQAQ